MYMTRGGNFVGYGINGIIFTISNLVGDYHLWPIITYLIGIIMVFTAVNDWIQGYNKWIKLLGVIALYNLYMLTSIDIAVTMWLCAMIYYLYAPAMLLLIKYLTIPHLSMWQWICLCLIALFLSGCNVTITPIALLCMSVIGLKYWHDTNWDVKHTWANPQIKRIVFVAIAMLCVYGIMFVAPGNFARMEGESDIAQPANFIEFVKACCACAGMFCYFMAFYIPYHLLVIALGFLAGTKSNYNLSIPKPKMILIIVFAFVLYLGISVMPLAYLSNGFHIQRNYTHIAFVYQLMLFAIGYVWGHKNSHTTIVHLCGVVLSVFLIVIMCINIHQDIPIARAYNQAHKEREAYLLTLQEQGNTDIVYVQKFPSTHSQDAKYTILNWIGRQSATQAIYYESDTGIEPNEYESHIRHLYNLDFDFVLPNE